MLAHDSRATITHSVDEEQATLDCQIFDALRSTLPNSALEEIYGVFLADTRKRVAMLRESRTPSSLPQLAHAICGSAGMVGASEIALLAERLEREPDAPARLMAACEHLQARLRTEGLAL